MEHSPVDSTPLLPRTPHMPPQLSILPPNTHPYSNSDGAQVMLTWHWHWHRHRLGVECYMFEIGLGQHSPNISGPASQH